MRIISKKKITEFGAAHADSLGALLSWHAITKRAAWKNLAEVRRDYPHADLVGDKTVFNIRGNNYRLITAIHFNTGKIYIRDILTHAEYDRGDWKER